MAKNVYIVTRGSNYEGGEVIGVYSDAETAVLMVETHFDMSKWVKDKFMGKLWRYGHEYVMVNAWGVDAMIYVSEKE